MDTQGLFLWVTFKADIRLPRTPFEQAFSFHLKVAKILRGRAIIG